MKRYWRVGSEWRLPPARFPEPEPEPSTGSALLQENGDYLLQETGDRILLEAGNG